MKGKKKLIVPLLLAGVTATGVVANVQQVQNQQVQAATSEINNVEGAELRIKPFLEDSYNVGDPVYLPAAEVVGGTETDEKVVYTVKKGNKTVKLETETDESTGHKGEQYFIAKYEGYYNVTVEVVKDNKVTSSISNLSVWVEKEDAVINLPVNSEYVIPAKIPSKQDGFKIPAPTVTVTENDEDVEKSLAKNTLTTEQLKVSLVTPSKTVDLSSKLDSTKNYFAVDKNDLEEIGTYQIVYEYVKDSSVISRLESNFQVVSEYDTSNIKLSMTFLDSVPSTGNVNTDISIPKVKVVDTNSNTTDAINAHIEVTVTNLKDPNEEIKVDYENYTFHPTKEGHYTVSYVASIPLFGENIKTKPVTPGDIIQVTDKQAPQLIPTYEYSFDTNGEIAKVNGIDVVATQEKSAREIAEEMLVNRRVDIPSVAVLQKQSDGTKSVKVTIPAAYATDNFYTYKGASNEDIKITRTYRKSTGSVVEVTVDPNKPAEIEFNTKGNSEIRYKAVDKAGNTLGEIVYDIVIYDVGEEVAAELAKGETKIDLNVGTKTISDKEKTLTFAKPTATDTYDKNVEVKTFYKVNGVATELTETNDDGKYEIDINKLISSNQSFDTFEIYAEAYVDSTLINTRGTDAEKNQLVNTNKVTSEVYTINLIKASSDTNAPEFSFVSTVSNSSWNRELLKLNSDKVADANGKSINQAGYLLDGEYNASGEATGSLIPVTATVNLAPFDQGNTIIKLPEVKFVDLYDANLTITMSIVDRFGNEVSKIDQESIEFVDTGSAYEYYISGASFKLSTYGVYTVTYTAQDIAGNITVKSYGIRVNDKTAPTITIEDEDEFGKEIEVGEVFTVPALKLTKNGEPVEILSSSWEIYKVSNNAKYSKQPNGFIPLTEGTFFIRYTATDIYGQPATLEDSMFTVTAKDTVKPTISLEMKYRMPATVKWSPAEGDDYMTIDIPVAFATDKLTKKDVEVVYTVTGPNGAKPTVTDYEDESKDHIKSFKATSEGVYTIKYTATDDAGNESTKTLTVEVGDCQKPELSWVNKDKDAPTEIELNKTYALDLNSMLKISDNETSKEDLLDKVTVQMTGPDGSTVDTLVADGEEYQWKFTKSGNYTLKITVKDKVGNVSEALTHTINVPAEDAEESKVSPVLGTVLVVLSVVVLAGVVVYFVATNKKKSAKANNKKSK